MARRRTTRVGGQLGATEDSLCRAGRLAGENVTNYRLDKQTLGLLTEVVLDLQYGRFPWHVRLGYRRQ